MKQNRKQQKLQTNENLRKDGLYFYNYYDNFSGKRQRIYAKTLEELRKKEEDLQEKQKQKVNISEAKMFTLNDVFDRYIASKYELRNSTKTNYLYMYQHFVRDGFGKSKVDSICYGDVEQFYKYLHYEFGLKLRTMDIINNIIHPTLQYAVRNRFISYNPSDGVMKELKRKSPETPRKIHALTLEQQRAFLSYVENHPIYGKWHPLLVVLLGTGLRVSEFLGLCWSNIDMNKRQIQVLQGLTYRPNAENDNHCFMVLSAVKTVSGVRTIPMLPEVYDAFVLLKHRELMVETRPVDGVSDFVFLNRFGQAFKAKSLNGVIDRIIRSYNDEEQVRANSENREAVFLPHFSCHNLRHTFCSRLIEAGAEAKFVQIIMGHSDISTTLNIYAEISEQKKTEMMQSFQQKIF